MTKRKHSYKSLLPPHEITPNISSRKWNKLFLIFIIIVLLYYSIFYTNLHENFHDTKIEEHAVKLQEHAVNLHNKVMKYFESSNKIILPESGIELEDGLTEDAKRFIKELNLTNPGVNGTGVRLDKRLLTEEHKNLIKQGWAEYGFNLFASNLVSFNRILADNRNEICKQKVYSKENLPKVSVVISFWNEGWSVLIRLMHSILLNTPEHLLEEIVLSDDFSDKENLQEPLEDYCKKLKKCKIVRSHMRLGIASTRVLGYRNARGPIIVGLDSHIEVLPGWLEPHLDRLKDNPTLMTAVTPKWLDQNTFQSHYDDWRNLVAFKFTFDFTWPRFETYQPELDYWEPHRSPIFYGPFIAFWKKFGARIGYIDTNFNIFGGDDIEFGIKAWLCGGSVENIPCSAIMHLPKKHKYQHNAKGKGWEWVSDRIVESWFDDNYKKYYYRTVGDTKNRDYGDITANLELKKKLKCHNFTWYVENVMTDLVIPDAIKDENWSTTTVKSLIEEVEDEKVEGKNGTENKSN